MIKIDNEDDLILLEGLFKERYKCDLNQDLDNYWKKITTGLENIPDMVKASELLMKSRNEHIVCVTDYDLDGITSAIIMYKSLVDIFGFDKVTVMNNRRKDGNGFNKILLGRIRELHGTKPISLIITADHGSSDKVVLNDLMEELDCDMVVTDHHTIPTDYELGSAFINTQRSDCAYSKNISGCNTVYLYLLYTYYVNYGNYDKFLDILPFVTLSVIGDVMALNDEMNRATVNLGLKLLNSSDDNVWRYLKKKLSISGTVNVTDLGFKLCPFISSANRTNREHLPFLIFTNNMNVEKNIDELISLNVKRKAEQNNIMKTLLAKNSHNKVGSVVVADTDLGINGIVASLIGRQHNTPTICFRKNNDTMVGSCRSILPGFNILGALKYLSDLGLVVKYGGHTAAAGCEVLKSNFKDFESKFNQYVIDNLPEVMEDREPIYINDRLLNIDTCRFLDKYEPYGKSFEKPIFKAKLMVYSVYYNDKFTKITFLLSDDRMIEGITFKRLGKVTAGLYMDVNFTLNISKFRNKHSAELEIKDIERSKVWI